MIPPPPRSTLFPYTTLFRSGQQVPINSVIELTVGKRTVGNLVSVPNLQGLTINEAEQRFGGGSSLRLFPVYMACETQSDSLNARVIRQTPVASDSSKVPEGSTITIFVSPNTGDLNEIGRASCRERV